MQERFGYRYGNKNKGVGTLRRNEVQATVSVVTGTNNKWRCVVFEHGNMTESDRAMRQYARQAFASVKQSISQVVGTQKKNGMSKLQFQIGDCVWLLLSTLKVYSRQMSSCDSAYCCTIHHSSLKRDDIMTIIFRRRHLGIPQGKSTRFARVSQGHYIAILSSRCNYHLLYCPADLPEAIDRADILSRLRMAKAKRNGVRSLDAVPKLTVQG